MAQDEFEKSPVQVLVVDDQAQFRSVLCDLVTATDGMVLSGEAASGQEALEAADRLAPQLVVMDVRMPGIDGVEATRRLVAAHPGTVVILVSVDGADAEGLHDCGAAAFLPKQRLSRQALAEAWREHAPAG